MRYHKICSVIMLLLLMPITSTLAGSSTQSFHISVTIPAIAGLNAPAETMPAASETRPPAVFTPQEHPEISIALRGQERILLKTFVVK